jgi:hypothetical protein
MKTTLLSATIASAWLAFVPVADAKIYKAVGTSTSQTYAANTTVYLKLNGAGVTSQSFSIPAAGAVGFTFSAECYGDTDGGWVSVMLEVDGNLVAPYNSDEYSFCSGGHSWSGNSFTAVKNLLAGTHTVRLKAVGYNSSMRIDDQLLTIFD